MSSKNTEVLKEIPWEIYPIYNVMNRRMGGDIEEAMREYMRRRLLGAGLYIDGMISHKNPIMKTGHNGD